jgi:hypothetical protein
LYYENFNDIYRVHFIEKYYNTPVGESKLYRNYTKILDFCFDYKDRLIFVELGNTLFIKKTSEKKDPSYIYSRKISGYSHDYLRMNKERTWLYFREESGDAIVGLDLTALDNIYEMQVTEEEHRATLKF